MSVNASRPSSWFTAPGKAIGCGSASPTRCAPPATASTRPRSPASASARISPGREVDLETHVNDVLGVIEHHELDNVVLCGHSYGGMVVGGAADRVAAKIASLVYLDAFIPEAGKSLWDFLPPEGAAAQKQQRQGWLARSRASRPPSSACKATTTSRGSIAAPSISRSRRWIRNPPSPARGRTSRISPISAPRASRARPSRNSPRP